MKKIRTTRVNEKSDYFQIGENLTLRMDYKNDILKQEKLTLKGGKTIKSQEWFKYHLCVHVGRVDDFLEQCKKQYFHTKIRVDKCWFEEYITKDLFVAFQNQDPDIKNLFLISHYDHTIRDLGGVPLDMLKHSDYIGGFRQEKKWNWNALKNHLQNHPDVLNFKVEQIPYYNCDYDDQEGLAFDYVFLGEWHNQIKDSWMKDYIVAGGTELDPLNVKQFMLQNHE